MSDGPVLKLNVDMRMSFMVVGWCAKSLSCQNNLFVRVGFVKLMLTRLITLRSQSSCLEAVTTKTARIVLRV